MEKEINRDTLEYRQKVTAVIVNAENQFLLIQKPNYGENDWDFPGGGIDEGEEEKEALFRELGEELGNDHFEILEKSEIKSSYEFPDHLIKELISKGKNFRGQEVTQFIVKFMGSDTDIRIPEEEIRKYKWVSYDELATHLNFPGQWDNIKEVLENSESLSL